MRSRRRLGKIQGVITLIDLHNYPWGLYQVDQRKNYKVRQNNVNIENGKGATISAGRFFHLEEMVFFAFWRLTRITKLLQMKARYSAGGGTNMVR